MRYYTVQFADSYSAGTYGGCTYNSAAVCTSTGAGTGTSGGSGLVNTGFVVLIIATVACILICAAILVRYWRRARRQPAFEPVKADDIESIDARSHQE